MNEVALEYICKTCGLPGVTIATMSGDPQWDRAIRSMAKDLRHDECADKALTLLAERRKAALEEEHTKKWETLCPAEFRKPISYTKTTAKKKFFDRIYSWQAKTGLWIHGKPGRCKTRFAWAMLRRHFNDGATIFAITHAALRERLSVMAGANSTETARWLKKVMAYGIVFCDDFGKGRVTEASEESTFDLIDYRYRENKPMVFTSEFTRQEAASKFKSSEGIQRRLEEMTECVCSDEF